MKLSNKSYDILKTFAWIVVPALTFIGAVCIIWNVPFAEQITATLAAFDTFLGTLLKTSNYQYNKPDEMDVSDISYIDDEEIEGVEVDE